MTSNLEEAYLDKHMFNISIDDIISAGREQSMRISHEATDGFVGDRQVTVTYNQYCHRESVLRSIVNAIFDHGDKVTICGDVNVRPQSGSESTYDMFVSFRVDPDSIVMSKPVEETNETGSSPAPVPED